MCGRQSMQSRLEQALLVRGCSVCLRNDRKLIEMRLVIVLFTTCDWPVELSMKEEAVTIARRCRNVDLQVYVFVRRILWCIYRCRRCWSLKAEASSETAKIFPTLPSNARTPRHCQASSTFTDIFLSGTTITMSSSKIRQ